MYRPPSAAADESRWTLSTVSVEWLKKQPDFEERPRRCDGKAPPGARYYSGGNFYRMYAGKVLVIWEQDTWKPLPSTVNLEMLYANADFIDMATIAADRVPEDILTTTFAPIADLSPTIDQTLTERGNRYGAFDEHARITQNIKRAMADSPNWAKLADDQKECLEMLAHKAGRILNGDPNYHDSWHDIVGYAKLVADRLKP